MIQILLSWIILPVSISLFINLLFAIVDSQAKTSPTGKQLYDEQDSGQYYYTLSGIFPFLKICFPIRD